MTAHQGYRVGTEADGVAPSPFEHLSGGYRWNGTPGWTGGNIPEVREDVPRSEAASKLNKSAEAKAERFRQFVQYRKDGLSVAEAGSALGIGSTASRQYEAERKAEAALAAAQEGGTP